MHATISVPLPTWSLSYFPTMPSPRQTMNPHPIPPTYILSSRLRVPFPSPHSAHGLKPKTGTVSRPVARQGPTTFMSHAVPWHAEPSINILQYPPPLIRCIFVLLFFFLSDFSTNFFHVRSFIFNNVIVVSYNSTFVKTPKRKTEQKLHKNINRPTAIVCYFVRSFGRVFVFLHPI